MLVKRHVGSSSFLGAFHREGRSPSAPHPRETARFIHVAEGWGLIQTMASEARGRLGFCPGFGVRDLWCFPVCNHGCAWSIAPSCAFQGFAGSGPCPGRRLCSDLGGIRGAVFGQRCLDLGPPSSLGHLKSADGHRQGQGLRGYPYLDYMSHKGQPFGLWRNWLCVPEARAGIWRPGCCLCRCPVLVMRGQSV